MEVDEKVWIHHNFSLSSTLMFVRLLHLYLNLILRVIAFVAFFELPFSFFSYSYCCFVLGSGMGIFYLLFVCYGWFVSETWIWETMPLFGVVYGVGYLCCVCASACCCSLIVVVMRIGYVFTCGWSLVAHGGQPHQTPDCHICISHANHD